MKKILVIVSIFLVFAATARADTIGGIDFDIPEEWNIVSETADDFYSQNVYSFEREVIAITVMPVDDEDMAIIYNESIYDCNKVFGSNDGFYLMTDINTTSDSGFLSRAQECVYMDGDNWCYGNLIGQNSGSHAVSLIYSAPTNVAHSQITQFGNIARQIISEVE